MTCNASKNINQTFIISSNNEISGACETIVTNYITNCGDDILIESDIRFDGNIEPVNDLSGSIGSATKRFREINVYSGNTSIWVADTKVVTPVLEPVSDLTGTVGTPVKRFREINAYSGNTSVWIADVQVITPSLDLGFDTEGERRIITADSSIIEDDCLLGGTF